MRAPTRLRSIESLAWEPMGPAHLSCKPLNQDPVTGARTRLLRSLPRDGVERKAQYHLAEEEFYCLDGRFTFDGRNWFRPGSYVCYPADVVHGARVSVPDGYVVYLRTSGSTEAHAVGVPLRTEAYPRAGGAAPLLIEDCFSGMVSMDGPCERELRGGSFVGRLVVAMEIPPDSPLPFTDTPWTVPLELLLIAGSLVIGGELVAAPAYGFYLSQAELAGCRSAERCRLLVHSGHWP